VDSVHDRFISLPETTERVTPGAFGGEVVRFDVNAAVASLEYAGEACCRELKDLTR
jgi:hypothetical protein